MKLNKIVKEIIDTGVRITLERNYFDGVFRKRWTKASVERMLTALDIAKEYKLEGMETWEDRRERLEDFVEYRVSKKLEDLQRRKNDKRI
jgi:hypothetical protein